MRHSRRLDAGFCQLGDVYFRCWALNRGLGYLLRGMEAV